jgi:hypothetical protein
MRISLNNGRQRDIYVNEKVGMIWRIFLLNIHILKTFLDQGINVN